MSFLYPLGLLGLIGVPILILIYILKNRYSEKVVSSIYIWNLSEKFLKRKKPLKKISDLLSLILQLVVIIILSVSIAHPVINIKDGAENICFVVDASGSMNILNGEETRFTLAKNKAREIVEAANQACNYTLIVASEQTNIVLENENSKEKFYTELDKLEVGYAYSNLDDALNLVQSLYLEEKIAETYLLTDCDYQEVKNINLINVATKEENYALYDTNYQIKNNKIYISGKIISYESDSNLNLNLYRDNELMGEKTIEVLKSVEEEFTFETDFLVFDKMKIEITNKDALSLDNSVEMYSLEAKNKAKTLLVSKSPFYLQAILKALGTNDVTIQSSYNNTKGYDLYIFDSYSPSILPDDGTVWLINTEKNIANSGFVVQDQIVLDNGGFMTYAEEKNSLYKELTQNISKNKMSIKKYHKYGLYREFTPIVSIDKIPTIFAGLNDFGNREIVFSFDFHDSDFPLLHDYIVLMKNFTNYSNPAPIEKNHYKVGDALIVNMLSDVESVRIEFPNHKVEFLDPTFNQDQIILSVVGTYKIDVNIAGEIKSYNVFVEFDNQEGQTYVLEDSLVLEHENKNVKFDGIYDNLFIIICAVCVFLLFDWVVYSYEQR